MLHELNANSWHTKIANFGRTWDIGPGDNMDICSYIRAVIGGAFRWLFSMLFLILAVSFFGAAIWDIIYWVYTDFADKLGFCGFVLISVSSLLLITVGVFHTVQFITDTVEDNKDTDNFVGLAYKKYKDNVCFKIRFK